MFKWTVDKLINFVGFVVNDKQILVNIVKISGLQITCWFFFLEGMVMNGEFIPLGAIPVESSMLFEFSSIFFFTWIMSS